MAIIVYPIHFAANDNVIALSENDFRLSENGLLCSFIFTCNTR